MISPQHLKALKAENVLRLVAVDIAFDSNGVVVIGGNNGHGKTSTLDAIEMALGGKKSVPPKPVHDGADEARVVLELSDLIVTREFKAGDSRLVVTSKDGVPYRQPQAILDALYDAHRIAFDPLEFMRLRDSEKGEALMRLVGLDFTALDAQRQRAYDQRTDVNRDVKAAERRVADLKNSGAPHKEVPASPLDTGALVQERAALESRAELRRQSNVKIDAAERVIAANTAEIARLQDHIDHHRKMLVGFHNDLEAIDDPTARLAEIDDQLGRSSQINQRVSANASLAAAERDLATHTAASNEYTRQISDIAEQKRSMIADAKYPVAGLRFTEDGDVLFNDQPLSQASAAEQLRVSTAIGLKLNPNLRLMLVRDGSLLDDSSMAELARMAEEADALVLVERVGDKDPGAVIIEDGRVRQ